MNWGGLMVQATEGSILSDLGLATALGVVDHGQGDADWPAGNVDRGARGKIASGGRNEGVFSCRRLGDQMLMSVSHTRLAVAGEADGRFRMRRSGWLSRSSYQSCLLTESGPRAGSAGERRWALTILQN